MQAYLGDGLLMGRSLVMGTRGSTLALAQSRQVAAALQATRPDLAIEERVVRTTGDRLQTAPLPAIGGKGVFTIEIEDALLRGEIDFAVHSLKDLPPELPAGLCLSAIPRRAPACDVCILQSAIRSPQSVIPLSFLPEGARVGTSSLRRRAQLLHWRPDLKIEDMRGNIDTRLRKLQEQNFQAIVLARAGLERLDVISDRQRQVDLDELKYVPAPGQGALAIEARTGDERVLSLLSAIEDHATRSEITAERAAMRALNAGCSTPLGARAVACGEELRMWAVVLSPDGVQRIFAQGDGRLADAAAIGERVARLLVERGATKLLPGL
jgi:hydroxymethylbilane synthase